VDSLWRFQEAPKEKRLTSTASTDAPPEEWFIFLFFLHLMLDSSLLLVSEGHVELDAIFSDYFKERVIKFGAVHHFTESISNNVKDLVIH